MFGQGVLEGLIASSVVGLAKMRGYLRLWLFGMLRQTKDVRVSFSCLLRLSKEGRYLLIRSNRRPEQFGPIGGVVKYYDTAQAFLDSVPFRPEVAASDMECDLRGFLPSKRLRDLVRWYERGDDCETAEACLRRELHEELAEIGSGTISIPANLCFKTVRQIWEGPRAVLGRSYKVFRIFRVCDMRGGSAVEELTKELWTAAEFHKDLLLASADEVILGRADDGRLIGGLSEYMFRSRVTRREPAALAAKLPRQDAGKVGERDLRAQVADEAGPAEDYEPAGIALEILALYRMEDDHLLFDKQVACVLPHSQLEVEVAFSELSEHKIVSAGIFGDRGAGYFLTDLGKRLVISLEANGLA